MLHDLLGYDDADARRPRVERRPVVPHPRADPREVPRRPDEGDMTSLPAGDDWAFEIKWDGYRTIVHIADGTVRLQSTAGHDVTARWPEFADLAASVERGGGRPRLRTRRVRRRWPAAIRTRAEQRCGFDAAGGAPTVRRAVRRTAPTRSTCRTRTGVVCSTSSSNRGRTGSCRRTGSATARRCSKRPRERGLEGVMAKRLGSTYRPGTRSKDWRKVKNRQRVELTIGGYTRGSGNRSSTFGALLVGVPDADSGAAAIRRRCRHRVQPRACWSRSRLGCAPCGATTARSSRSRRRATGATPSGSVPNSAAPPRSPSSRTRASSATPASSS